MGIGRKALEFFSRDRVIRRSLPATLGSGKLFVSPDASLGLWKATLESDLFDFAREFVHPGQTVWDIGANVGLFAFAAANRAGPSGTVTAVEADNWLVGLLRKSAAVQPPGSAPVKVLSCAVSSAACIADFHIAERGRASNHLALSLGSHRQSGGVRRTIQVLTITLDWLLEQGTPPNVVKIDVEGAELSVLQAANRVLREVRPVILCEVSAPARDQVTELLQSCGYQFYDWDNRAAGQMTHTTWNTLAIPAT